MKLAHFPWNLLEEDPEIQSEATAVNKKEVFSGFVMGHASKTKINYNFWSLIINIGLMEYCYFL